jgi:hypothetical protein
MDILGLVEYELCYCILMSVCSVDDSWAQKCLHTDVGMQVTRKQRE